MVDPATGLDLLVGTERGGPGQGVLAPRRAAEFDLAATWQGVVVAPLSDGLVLRAREDGFVLSAEPDGLAVSLPDGPDVLAPAAAMTRRFDFSPMPDAALEERLRAQIAAASARPPLARGRPRREAAQIDDRARPRRGGGGADAPCYAGGCTRGGEPGCGRAARDRLAARGPAAGCGGADRHAARRNGRDRALARRADRRANGRRIAARGWRGPARRDFRRHPAACARLSGSPARTAAAAVRGDAGPRRRGKGGGGAARRAARRSGARPRTRDAGRSEPRHRRGARPIRCACRGAGPAGSGARGPARDRSADRVGQARAGRSGLGAGASAAGVAGRQARAGDSPQARLAAGGGGRIPSGARAAAGDRGGHARPDPRHTRRDAGGVRGAAAGRECRARSAARSGGAGRGERGPRAGRRCGCRAGDGAGRPADGARSAHAHHPGARRA